MQSPDVSVWPRGLTEKKIEAPKNNSWSWIVSSWSAGRLAYLEIHKKIMPSRKDATVFHGYPAKLHKMPLLMRRCIDITKG